MTVILHEDEVPQFEEPVVLRLQHGDDSVHAHFWRIVPVYLAGRPAGSGVGHLPEVGFLVHPRDTFWINADLIHPYVVRLVVVLVHGERQALRWQAEYIREQLVGKVDCVTLEIIAE